MNRTTRRTLRRQLAELYSNIPDIQRILADAGVDQSRINLNAAAGAIWHGTLREAEKSGQIAELVAIVVQEYPNNQALRDLTTKFATNEPPAGQQHRVWTIAVAATVALASLLGFGIYHADWSPWHQPQRLTTAQPTLCFTTHPCFLIADFAPTGDELADEITRKVRTTLDNSDLITTTSFIIAPTAAITSTHTAQQLVNQEDALVLVWGQLFHSFEELTINIALTDQLGIDESRTIRPYRVPYFDSLTQQITCSGSCFTDLNSARAFIDQISAVIAYTVAGMVHYANDQPEAAITAFGQALACAGEDLPGPLPSTSSGIGLGWGCPLQPTLLQPIDGLDPAALYYYVGKAHILTGDYRTAIALLEIAAARNPQDPAAQIAIATAYQSWLGTDDAPQALAALEMAKEQTLALRTDLITQQAPSEELAAVKYTLGFIAELGEDWQAAIDAYSAAIATFGEENPTAYVSLVALGRAQRLAGNQRQATIMLQRATELDATAPWAWLELAQRYQENRRRATTQLERAHQAAPNQVYVDIIEAMLCEAWADFACAQAAYERALAKRPRSGWLHDRIGEFYSHHSWEQAATYYEQAVVLRPQHPWTRNGLPRHTPTWNAMTKR